MNNEDLKLLAEGVGHTTDKINHFPKDRGGIAPVDYDPRANAGQLLTLQMMLLDKGWEFFKEDGVYCMGRIFGLKSVESKDFRDAIIDAALMQIKGD